MILSLTYSLTPSIKPSVKKSIPMLVLLAIILVLSGCVGKAIDGAINRATSSVTDFVNENLPDIAGVNDIAGIDGLGESDPCLARDALFSSTFCTSPANENIAIYNDLREVQCLDDYDAPLCAPTVRRVCTANARKQLCHDIEPYNTARLLDESIVSVSDWMSSFTTDDSAATVIPLARTANHAVAENLFLADLTLAELKKYTITKPFKDGFKSNDGDPTKRRDEQRFTIVDADTGTRGLNRSIGTLTLAHTQEHINAPYPAFHGFKEPGATATDDESTGDVNDGVSFVAGQFNRRFGECIGGECAIHRYYAGVHATTELGAPITNGDQVSQWRGLLRAVGVDNLTSLPFDITITFSQATKGGTIKADFTEAGRHVIDATYDRFGAITGNVNLLNSPGKVSGIIGQEGLVAAFISDFTGVKSNRESNPAGYAGGFVAYLPNPIPPDPCLTNPSCVDYVHWVTPANPATTPTANRFLTGTAGGLTTGRSFVGKSTTLGGSNAARSNVLKAEDPADGFAIFYDGTTHNAGLLSTTRLDAPWRNGLTNAEWLGQFVERVGQENDVRLTHLTLTVNFSGASGTIAATNVGRSNLYSFTADFDNYGAISNGVITRTVEADVSQGILADTSTGIVTGLVGAGRSGFGAAVGVFHSDVGATTSYVGGFVASGNKK